MKKLVLIALLGAVVGNAWGAASRKPPFLDKTVNRATAIKDLEEYVLNSPYLKPNKIGPNTFMHLVDTLNMAIYSGQLDLAGIYATIITLYAYEHTLNPFYVAAEVELLAHYGVPDEILAKIIAKYGK